VGGSPTVGANNITYQITQQINSSFTVQSGDAVFVRFTDATVLYVYNGTLSTGSWVVTTTIGGIASTGPTGASGSGGAVGATGAAGRTGARFLNGARDPFTALVSAYDGDYYIDVLTGNLWYNLGESGAQFSITGLVYSNTNGVGVISTIVDEANEATVPPPIASSGVLMYVYSLGLVAGTAPTFSFGGNAVLSIGGTSRIPGTFILLGNTIRIGSTVYNVAGDTDIVYIATNTPIGGTADPTFVPGTLRLNASVTTGADPLFAESDDLLGLSTLSSVMRYDTGAVNSGPPGSLPGIYAGEYISLTNSVGVSYQTSPVFSLGVYFPNLKLTFLSDTLVAGDTTIDDGTGSGAFIVILRPSTVRKFSVYLVEDSSASLAYDSTFSSIQTITVDVTLTPGANNAITTPLYVTTLANPVNPGIGASGGRKFDIVLQDVTGDGASYELFYELTEQGKVSFITSSVGVPLL
jgi:hypothetical protein